MNIRSRLNALRRRDPYRSQPIIPDAMRAFLHGEIDKHEFCRRCRLVYGAAGCPHCMLENERGRDELEVST